MTRTSMDTRFYDLLIPVLNVGGSSPFGRASRKTAESLGFQGLSAVFCCVQFGPDRAKISTFRHLGAGTAAGTKSGFKWADCSQTRPRLAGNRWLSQSRK